MSDLRGWRLSREGELELPSGLTVRVRRVPLAELAEGGTIPAPLVDVVNKMLKSGVETRGIDVAQIVELGAVLNVVARAAIIWPPISDVADDEHLALSELSFEDRSEILRWCNAPAKALEPFREQSVGAVAAPLPG